MSNENRVLFVIWICASLVLGVMAGPRTAEFWGLPSWAGYPIGLGLFALAFGLTWLYRLTMDPLMRALEDTVEPDVPRGGASPSERDGIFGPRGLIGGISFIGAFLLSAALTFLCMVAVCGIGSVRLLPVSVPVAVLCVLVAVMPLTVTVVLGISGVALMVFLPYELVRRLLRRREAQTEEGN
jgi:hypothetical protein